MPDKKSRPIPYAAISCVLSFISISVWVFAFAVAFTDGLHREFTLQDHIISVIGFIIATIIQITIIVTTIRAIRYETKYFLATLFIVFTTILALLSTLAMASLLIAIIDPVILSLFK